jgi:pseudaminic acid biosynthesis-associated methylase
MSERDTPLSELWAGSFGDDYAQRNAEADRGRRPFWQATIERLAPVSALEVGCNVGGNLLWLAEILGAENVAGVDVNERALAAARERVPGADLRLASALELPFADASFDLVFTTGVLIHQSSGDLPSVMSEIVRCSRRHVLCGEYFGDEETEVPYRGERGALFRRDYGGLYARAHPELRLVHEEFLTRGPQSSWDDVTVWVFEKQQG